MSEQIKNLKPLILPILSVFIFILFSFFTLSQVWNRIRNARQELTDQARVEAELTEKLSALEVAQSEIAPLAQEAIRALPSENSSLLVLSQIRQLTLARGALLANPKVGSVAEVNQKISRVEVSFDVDSTLSSVLGLLKDVVNSTPITAYEKVKIVQAGGAARGTVKLSAYWAALPTKLPAVNEPIPELTAEEKELLAELGNLLSPPFNFEALAPQTPAVRANPFQ